LWEINEVIEGNMIIEERNHSSVRIYIPSIFSIGIDVRDFIGVKH